MIDIRALREEVSRAIDRFEQRSAITWAVARRRYFLDLREDPSAWWSPVRAANTNGSILLDRYACVLTPEAIDALGWELAFALLTLGVTTERSALFHAPRHESPTGPV